MSDRATVTDQRRSRRPMGTDRVPVLPPGVLFLMQALSDDNLGFREIAGAIENVPSIAARLLALANSAWSSPASPILSLEAACSRLGLRVVRTASIALAVSQPFNPARCPAFDGSTFWSTALLNAEAASHLAGYLMRDQVSVARTAGLLSSLGLVWLAESLPTQTGAALQSSHEAPPGGLNHALEAQCGLGYDEAGALLADAWQLPEQLRNAIAHQFHPRQEATPLCQVVSAATRMVGTARRNQDWEQADTGLSQLGLDLEAQSDVFAQIAAIRTKMSELAETLFIIH